MSMTEADIIKLAVETGVNAALDHIERQRRKESKSRHDRRLRNTRLLLKNYQLLKDHCDKAVYTMQQATAENAIDILDSLNKYDGDVFIESIKKSRSRTYIILTHVDTMLELYEAYCQKSKREEDPRRYRVLKACYFDNVEMSDIMRLEGIEERTYYRDIRDGCEKLSALIFGVDGLIDMT